ncbi:YpsA SLOG family protein [Marinobacter nauticus]|uniref:YpsA SLOG family protein n=1 Tax=Marinobacter nauticus TaxID=2743 RepID=UPI001160BB15
MDNANQELEGGAEPVYDRVRGSHQRLRLTPAVTQNYLHPLARAATLINQFITAKNIHILNIAGARESRSPGIYEFVLSVLLTSQQKPLPLTPETQR